MSNLRIFFHITDECNMACAYCYEHKSHNVIKIEYAKTLIDEIINLLNNTTKSWLYGYLNCEKDTFITLDFIGGEITLYMEIVTEICDYFFAQFEANDLPLVVERAKIVLETNGTTYFNQDVQDFLTKYHDRVELPITIDGCRECHDCKRQYKNGAPTFDDVDAAIRGCIQDFGVPNSKMTFTPDTFKYILPSCQYLYSLGYKTCRFNPDVTRKMSIKETEDYYNALIELADWIIDKQVDFIPNVFIINYTHFPIRGSCGMNGSQIAIDSNGNLFNCFHFSRTQLLSKELPIGNVQNKYINHRFVRWFLGRINIHNDIRCMGCPIIEGCEECPVINYQNNGNLFTSFNNCGATIAAAKAQAYFLQKAIGAHYPFNQDKLAEIVNEYTDDFPYLLYKENDRT